jgi:CelD/BcsL family acetyltransferase involved in cellulose biosynthesis
MPSALADPGSVHRVEVVRDLGTGAESWGALADRMAAPPALYPGYVASWVAAYSAPERLRVVTVWRGDRLAAVLPLVLDRSHRSTVAMRDVEEAGLVSDGPASALAAVRGAFAMGVGRVLLRPVVAGGATHVAFAAAAEDAGGATLARVVDEQPVVDVAGPWEPYWRSLSRNTRSDVARRRRRLAEAGEVTIEVLDGSVGLEAALETAMLIEASGWKGRAGTALASRPDEERFHRLLAIWAARRGWFRLTFLRLDGRPIAFHFSLQAHGIVYPLKIGFAEDMAPHSPGTILMAAEIERAFAEGLSRFDFAGSAADYKNRWSTGSRVLIELSAFPPGVAGAAARAAGRVRVRAIPVAKRARAGLRALRISRR